MIPASCIALLAAHAGTGGVGQWRTKLLFEPQLWLDRLLGVVGVGVLESCLRVDLQPSDVGDAGRARTGRRLDCWHT